MYPSLTILALMFLWMSLSWVVARLRGKPTKKQLWAAQRKAYREELWNAQYKNTRARRR